MPCRWDNEIQNWSSHKFLKGQIPTVKDNVPTFRALALRCDEIDTNFRVYNFTSRVEKNHV